MCKSVFFTISFFDVHTRNVENCTGGGGEYYRDGAWLAIKDINHLGDSAGKIFSIMSRN